MVSELEDDLDVSGLLLDGPREVVEQHPAGDHRRLGSGISITAAEPACSGITVSARMAVPYPVPRGSIQGFP